MSLLVLLFAMALPVILARLLVRRIRTTAAVVIASGFLPFGLVLWGVLARAGVVSSRFILSGTTDFARREQWIYLVGGCAFLFGGGLVAAWLSLVLKRAPL